MPVTVVVGAQWGDEGKGKVIDLLASEADWVVRYQGGGNAGHTVKVGDRQYVLHLVPSGVLHDGKTCVIGNGVVVDPELLVAEVDDLAANGRSLDGRLFISDLAHVTLPYHRRMDEAHEAKRGAGKIGTTHRGIGPTYADKFGRVGIRMGDLLDPDVFLAKVRRNLEEKDYLFRNFYGVDPVTIEEIEASYRKYISRLGPMITDTVPMLRDAVARGRRVLLEGAQGTLLDVDFGTYPYVTASNPTVGGALTGSGLPATAVTGCVAVAKAYTTRVGAGPLPTALPGDEDEKLRVLGREYGATTGRPRRTGWFDAVAVRRAVAVNGPTELAVTKLDILDTMDRIQVCVAYEYKGREMVEFPNSIEVVEKVKPVYREFGGWKVPTTGIRRWDDLPGRAKEYLEGLSGLVGVKITIVSVGPERNETIRVRG